MGKLGFTPLIGLAVVVALALAAVFGAMSLTNPAFAAIGAPADTELAERTFSPQVATLEIAKGETKYFNITSHIDGGRAAFTSLVADSDDDAVVMEADPDFQASSTVVELGLRGVEEGDARVTATVTRTGNLSEQIIVFAVEVGAEPDSTPATKKGRIEPKDVEIGVKAADSATDDVTQDQAGDPFKVDVSGSFNPGEGPKGEIASYTVSIVSFAPADSVEISDDEDAEDSDWIANIPSGAQDAANMLTVTDGVFYVRATSTALKDNSARIQAVANDGIDRPGDGDDAPVATQRFYVDFIARGAESEEGDAIDLELEGGPSLMPDSIEPGDGTRYDIEFKTTEPVNTLTDELVIKLGDFDLPSSIATRSVAIIVTDSKGKGITDSTMANANRDFIPEDVTVSGSKVIITLGDMDKGDDNEDFGISSGSIIKVVLRQSAGISNPSEAKKYGPVIELGDSKKLDWEEENADGDPMYPGLILAVPRIIGLDEEDGGLGTVVNATGSGYKNGTSLIVFVDKPGRVTWNPRGDSSSNMVPLPAGMVEAYNTLVKDDPDRGNRAVNTIPNDDGMAVKYYEVDDVKYAMAPNRELDLGEDTLCVVSSIGGDDTGTCEFTVTHPTFTGGINYINAVDGRDGYVDLGEDLGEFDLTASVKASPPGGSPGEIMQIQVVDFPPGAVGPLKLSRSLVVCTACGNADSTGSASFPITIPNDVKAGVQNLQVISGVDSDVKADTNVTFIGPQIQITPKEILANQRVSLVGTGFSPGAVIANDRDVDGVVDPVMSIGGDVITSGRINDSDPVRVDNGGNWSASVDMPLSEATTAEGERAIRVTDSRGRTGVVLVDVPSREVTITPDSGRVGTIAVVRGTGFPSKNDEGSSFNITIEYDASNDNTTTVSASPDASGRFESQLRIPTTAAIPSTNTVRVEFEAEGVAIVTTVAHEVPEGIITLSETSGGPGSTVTISGEGFKSFVPISLVKIGTLDVTPAPKPSTDGNGMMSFDVTIPGLDVGIQTIETHVGRTTASTGFTVTESGINPGNIKEVGPALEDLGDNFVNIWHFNNDLKSWSFYDGMEGSDLTHLITGETYLIQIKSTIEVILNNDTRNLTCVGANCWNQIVW